MSSRNPGVPSTSPVPSSSRDCDVDESDCEVEESDCDVDELDVEPSVCASATAAPLPSMMAANAVPPRSCFSRMLMSFTPLRV